jgi:hypothetical protein
MNTIVSSLGFKQSELEAYYLTTHLCLVQVENEWSYTYTSPHDFMACVGMNLSLTATKKFFFQADVCLNK